MSCLNGIHTLIQAFSPAVITGQNLNCTSTLVIMKHWMIIHHYIHIYSYYVLLFYTSTWSSVTNHNHITCTSEALVRYIRHCLWMFAGEWGFSSKIISNLRMKSPLKVAPFWLLPHCLQCLGDVKQLYTGKRKTFADRFHSQTNLLAVL